ncbi:response regulator [Hymenobacter elongatus]|nr:response regulator [Hymenobacter elongatus]
MLPPFQPSLRVLVVDDNELNQLVVCRALEEWNVAATLADNGRQAVALATTQAFDVVLMDVQMPEMDGYEATRQLRGHSHLQRLPIIGLTASTSPEDQARARVAGMNATLAKPFDPALLHASLVCYTSGAGFSGIQKKLVSLAGSGTVRPDWGILEELAAGNRAFIAQIITTFLQQTPPLYQQLVTAASIADDPLTPARLAHKLKGQVVYFGVPAIQQHLEKLERSVTTTAAATNDHLIALIGDQLTALYPYLAARLHKYQSE